MELSKLMRTSTTRLILGIGMIALPLCGGDATASSGTASDVLTAGQIYEKMLEHYASLPSYSDQGSIVTTMDGLVVTSGFATRLARPGFYRIEWEQNSTDNTGIQGAWSAGQGDFVQMMGSGLRRLDNRNVAFGDVVASSGGALATVPRMFFEAQVSSERMMALERLPDIKVGNIECFELTGQSPSGQIKTFWIGKRDFLIRQIQTEVNREGMQAAWTEITGGRLEPSVKLHGFISTTTYTNIVINTQFSQADFYPSFPVFRPASF
jgi:hypothetical protein